ncbi:FAD/NAD(P)-binding domain-containing protein [Mollisia scopiformis]|uniref:FAD/NAD(P)-binding domain-containing protein n=1 Tax=Mollisia scopiformis TaxID=149040 RepID=A0A194XDE7_MOLSC|nr:FAD/NAD(P)-binding domain-containing protein [Mollisia scopiformis]KUJ18198.1 FAD/NAD(P)-binding domain-containing protein [Mollisia scopiformis]
MEPQPINVAIIGAGIAGLAFAIGLSKYPHITFIVYESRPSYAEIGAGIGFSTNGHKAMSLISPKLWENYQSHASFNGSPEKRGIGFNYEVGEKGLLEGKRIIETVMPEGYMQSTCHRKHLLSVLVETLPDKGEKCTVFNKKLVEVDDTGKKLVCVFADGEKIKADLVVGCDGIKSACRQFVFGKDSEIGKAQFTGKVAYRGLVPMEKAIAAVGEDRARNRQMYFGHHRHMLTFGVAKGTMMNVVAFHSTGSDAWEYSSLVQPRTIEDFLRDFVGWGDAVTNIISSIENPEVWAIFDHPRVDTFHKGRIVLLGDAAHTTSPHYGMGGGMSVEDASILSSLLGSCTSVNDVAPMLKVYDSIRVDRCCDIVAASREQGRLCDFEADWVGDDLEKISEQLDSELRRWMWDYDPEVAYKKALEEFEREKGTVE